ncbi:MAG TPA: CvpA family protein [Casimicrobiaceae bacterium]|nr:CvpA family protein [Casimicrobiaceae bacterium]
MTAFDLMVIGIVGLSTILAFWHGFVRVIASLATWVLAVLAGIQFSTMVGTMLPDFGETPGTRYFAAFALIMIGVLIVGALVGFFLSRLVSAVGLGFLDRLVGAVFGFARGVLIAVVVVLFAGLTTLPKKDWWQNALTSPTLTTAALSLRPWLPKAWADRLDYGPGERRPAKPVVKAAV